MSTYNVVAASNESTVVTEYEPQSKRSDAYQSEAALEQAFIRMLEEQGYAYLPIHENADLVVNLRRQLELLNNYTFTDKEWDFFFKDKIANANDGIKEKTRRIQEDNIQNLTREDGSTVNITLLDKKNIGIGGTLTLRREKPRVIGIKCVLHYNILCRQEPLRKLCQQRIYRPAEH